MSVSMVDKTGEPRSDKELQEAIEAVKQAMVKPPITHPMLVVNLLAIKELLLELQIRRQQILL